MSLPNRCNEFQPESKLILRRSPYSSTKLEDSLTKLLSTDGIGGFFVRVGGRNPSFQSVRPMSEIPDLPPRNAKKPGGASMLRRALIPSVLHRPRGWLCA